MDNDDVQTENVKHSETSQEPLSATNGTDQSTQSSIATHTTTSQSNGPLMNSTMNAGLPGMSNNLDALYIGDLQWVCPLYY